MGIVKYKKETPNTVYYVTDCGCRLILIDTRYQPAAPRICKEHGGQVAHKERKCLDCDFIIKFNGVKVSYRCEAHKKTAKQARSARSHKKAKKNKPRGSVLTAEKRAMLNQFNGNPRGSYCTGYEACNICKTLNCAGCKTFIPIIKGVDPEIRGYY